MSHEPRLHAGPSVEAAHTLRLSDFERFSNENECGSADEIREALATLLPHLRDELVQVEQVKACEPGNSRLTVFRHPVEKDRSCYVLVSSYGEVAVGPTDSLTPTSRRSLDGFDPVREEVLSVSVTSRLRFVGTACDLFIVVRRIEAVDDDPSESYVYHGLIRFENDDPEIALSQDDPGQASAGIWRRSPGDRLPEILKRTPLYISHDVDPFSRDFPPVSERLPGADSDLEHTQSLALTKRSICGIYGDTLILVDPKERIIRESFGDKLAYLATVDTDHELVRGLFGFESRRLAAFEAGSSHEGGNFDQQWRHYLSDFPSCAAFLPDDPKGDWPDFLVEFRNGDLARLRYFGQKRIADLWSSLWQRLEKKLQRNRRAIAEAARQDAPDRGANDDEQQVARWLRAAFLGAVEQSLYALREARDPDFQDLKEKIVALFEPTSDYRTLTAPLHPLLQELRAEVNRVGGPEPKRTRFLLEVLGEIYEKQQKANVEIPNQIGQVIGSLEQEAWERLVETSSDRKKITELREKSQRNQQVIWQEINEPSTTSSHHVERAGLGMERWASAFLPAHIVHIGRWKNKSNLHGATGFATGRGGDRKNWLAVASFEGLGVYEIDRYDRLSLDPVARDNFLGNNQVLSIPGSPGLLLVRGFDQTLKLFRFDPKGKELSQLTPEAKLSRFGTPDSWALVAQPDGACLGIVTCQRGRRSEWVLFAIEKDDINILSHHSASLPGVSCLDLATHKDGSLSLLAGSSLGGPVSLYRIRQTENGTWGEFEKVDDYWPSAGGTSSVRFVTPHEPDSFLIGDISGFIWCGQIQTNQYKSRLAWVYQLDAAIRSILPLEYEGEPHALVGSDAGKIVFLRCSDALRLWTHRLQAPIRELAMAIDDRQTVVATLTQGWLCTFEKVADREKALALVESALEKLGQEPQTSGHTLEAPLPDTRIVQALAKLRQSDELDLEILPELTRREHRARVLRYLAERGPAKALEDCRALLPQLTCREIQLLLSYLPKDFEACDQIIRDALEDKLEEGTFADDSRFAAETAWVAFLHRLERRDVSVGKIMQFRPRNFEWYESRWIRLETARVFLKALARKISKRKTHGLGEGSLFAHSLPYLFRFPPSFLSACAEVLPNTENEHRYFKICHEVVLSFEDSRSPEDKKITSLVEALNPHRHTSDLAKLLHDFLSLLLAWKEWSDEGEEDWANWRQDLLPSWRQLLESVWSIEASELRDFRQHGVRLLQSRFVKEPIPEDTVTQAERGEWINRARATLLQADSEPREEISEKSPWGPIVPAPLTQLKEICREFLDLEEKHLLQEIRPFLALQEVRRFENNEVVATLEIIPEGRRILEDVSLRIDANIEGGIRGARDEDSSQILKIPAFHAEMKLEPVELAGYLERGAESFVVRSILEGSGTEHKQLWEFRLPSSGTEGSSLPSKLRPFQRLLEFLGEEIQKSQDRSVLLALDEILGRDRFATNWQQANGGRLVDLDGALAHYGPGQRYSLREIDLGLVLETLDIESDPTRPIMISPSDQVLDRWLHGESRGTIEAFVQWLRTRSEGPQVVWVVSSTHAAQIRALDIRGIPMIQGHRPRSTEIARYGEEHELAKNEFWETLIDAGTESAFLRAKPEFRERVWHTFQNLGGDLYFIAHWLEWIAKNSQAERPLRAFNYFFREPPVKRRLDTEFRSLSSADLLIALVGAQTSATLPFSRVEAGQIAAESHYSTTIRQSPKLLQKEGTALTERSLLSLRADARSPGQIRLQGLSLEYPVAAESWSGMLLTLAKHRATEDLVSCFRRLASFGIGTWSQGLFRTNEPYRNQIRSTYQELKEIPAQERDAQVYRAILGENRTPLETLSIREFLDASSEEIQAVLRGSRPGEVTTLRNLAVLWDSPKPDASKLLQVYLEIFGSTSRSVWQLSSHEARWDDALLKMPFLKMGVGLSIDDGPRERYPDGYHYWMLSGEHMNVGELRNAIDETVEKRRAHLLARENTPHEERISSDRWAPKIILTGPGVEALNPDREGKMFAVLKSADYLQAALEGDIGKSLLRRARSQMRLITISPFQTSGPIPPGSKYFFGRGNELKYIQTRLAYSSFLIIGSRRVGKTSFLNQVRHLAEQNPAFMPLYLDAQGLTKREDFLQALKTNLSSVDTAQDTSGLSPKKRSFTEWVRLIHQKTRSMPIFLINEIDGLALHDIEVLKEWRALHESNHARFVMTAYATVSHFGNPESPFFNWTIGPEYSGQAITLAQLSSDGARDLLGMLTGQELGLQWASKEEHEKAMKALLDRSYRIPWVLQVFGQKLVERMEANPERRGILTFADVEDLLKKEGNIVWRYFQEIQYSSLGLDEIRASQGPGYRAQRPGYQLVLFSLVHSRYFTGDEPLVQDPEFYYRDPLDEGIGFTVAEARSIVKSTLAKLLIPREKKIVEGWFDRLDLERTLPLLTLTLMLEVDPKRKDRFGFLMHILPRELLRESDDLRGLEDLIINKAAEFLTLVQ